MPDHEISYLGNLTVMVPRKEIKLRGTSVVHLLFSVPIECVTSPGQPKGKGDKNMVVGGYQAPYPHQLRVNDVEQGLGDKLNTE